MYLHHRVEIVICHLVEEAVAQDPDIVHDCANAAESFTAASTMARAASGSVTLPPSAMASPPVAL